MCFFVLDIFYPVFSVLRDLNLKSFTAKYAEKARRAAEPLYPDMLCATLRITLRLSAVKVPVFAVIDIE